MSVTTMAPLKRKKSDAKSPRKRRCCRPSITELPTELIADIFSRAKLPIKTISSTYKGSLSYRNKELKAAFSNPKFAKAQSNYSRNCIFSYQFRCPNKGSRRFFLVESNNDNISSIEIDMGFMGKACASADDFLVFGSCNGLILGRHTKEVWVSNPLTKEFMIIPQTETDLEKDYQYAIGFDNKKSNKYKVVRLLCDDDKTGCWSGEILTVGTQTWRKIDRCDEVFKERSCLYKGPVEYKGCLNWIVSEGSNEIMVRFDVEMEKFERLALPFDVGETSERLVSCSFGVVDDQLYVGANEILKLSELEIWVLDRYGVGDVWEKVIAIPIICGARSSVELNQVAENGDILLMFGRQLSLSYYTPKTDKFRDIRVCGISKDTKGVNFRPNLISLETYL